MVATRKEKERDKGRERDREKRKERKEEKATVVYYRVLNKTQSI